MNLGVTIAVCCYNSALRLERTLAHLAAQTTSGSVPWEVLIINNASTDHTEEAARQLWPADAPAPLRVVNEPRQGQTYARLRAFKEATYGVVSFVDDDNWVAPDWVEKVHEFMSANPEVGAVGGLNTPVADRPLPSWFARYQHNYAVGPQANSPGDITRSRGRVCGAGLSVRKSALDTLLEDGFEFHLPGRRGRELYASEDYELCFALTLAGWKIWYEPSLRLDHYMPEGRLNWTYLRRLCRCISHSGVMLDPYLFALGRRDGEYIIPFTRCWEAKVVISAVKLTYHVCAVAARSPEPEGEPRLLKIDCLIGRLTALLKNRDLYKRHIKSVSCAKWRAQRRAERPALMQTVPTVAETLG